MLTASPFRFDEVAEASGIRFEHYSPFTEQRHTHLTYGSGVGWFDYDGDQWPDLYLCQGASYQPGKPIPDDSSPGLPSSQMFQNRQRGSFANVSQETGLGHVGYSMGVAAADYDNDGFPDVCVTGYYRNRLYHNNGDGTFHEVALPEGTVAGRLSTSCAWADVDADGNLDLFIANYANLSPENYPVYRHTEAGKTIHVVCHPCLLTAMTDLLLQNSGNGEFRNISAEAGISGPCAHCGLGVAAADLDGDGDVDIYVANDTTCNQLWENSGKGSFVDRGVDSGSAYDRHGATQAGMGVAVGDFDGDSRFDILVGNFYGEANSLYRQEGPLQYLDVSDVTGLASPSRVRLTFGVALADFDNDGWPDVFFANGHVHDRLHELKRNEPFAQLADVFHNERGVRFADVSSGCGPYFTTPRVGRGSAVADYDRDGDVDLAVNHLNGPAALVRNETAHKNSWLQIELVGTQSNRDGVGAVLKIDTGQRVLVRARQAGTSYLSCDEARVFVGLGDAARIECVSVRWPAGREEKWAKVPGNRVVRLVEGAGDGS